MSGVLARLHPSAPMDSVPVAEILPGLYRAVLDAVADLESRNRRPEAAVIRFEATRVYSRAWTPDAARRLETLRNRAGRIIQSQPRTRYEAVIASIGRSVETERRTVDVDRLPGDLARQSELERRPA
jgi:hypothetical protein